MAEKTAVQVNRCFSDSSEGIRVWCHPEHSRGIFFDPYPPDEHLHTDDIFNVQIMHITIDTDVQKLHNIGGEEVQNRDGIKRKTGCGQDDPKRSC